MAGDKRGRLEIASDKYHLPSLNYPKERFYICYACIPLSYATELKDVVKLFSISVTVHGVAFFLATLMSPTLDSVSTF
jgi:hypothetical protein